MVNNDHTTQYSAADIQRYLEGKMPAADMHALENAALDDPFLADAIEGMQQTLEQHDANIITASLQDINRQVAERIKKEDKQTRVVAFRWWQVAAAAVVVVAAGIGVYRYMGQSAESPAANTTVAKVESSEKADSPVAVISPATAITDSARVTTVIPENNEQETAKAVTPAAKTSQSRSRKDTWYKAKADQQNAAKEEVVIVQPVQEKQASNLIATDSVTVVGFGSKKPAQPAPAARQQTDYEQIVIPKTKRDSLAKDYYSKPRADLAMNPSKKELAELSDKQLSRELKKNPNALLSGYIKGRVSDQFNNPLYNAVVRVEDQRDFLTDKQGYFKIPVSDSTVKIAVGYNGFYTQNLQLQNNARENRITLNQLGVKPPNPTLNNVIVKQDTVQYYNADDRARSKALLTKRAVLEATTVTTQNAQPEYGWLEYHHYLDKNKKAPAGDTLTGKVIVSFEVDKKGSLSDFKIEQSLRKDYDEEAIRLIKAGPSWKLTSGDKARATIIVNF